MTLYMVHDVCDISMSTNYNNTSHII